MSKIKRILIVEDEPDLAELVAYNLQRAGYEPTIALDGSSGLQRIRSLSPDLVLLDVMIPKLSGLELAREVRADPRIAAIPILMLTAKAGEADQLAGLGFGADDYMTKPFSMKVLLARVEALLRRAAGNAPESDRIALGPIEADLGTHSIRLAGRGIRTTLTEFRILVALVQAKGKTLSRLDLMARVMGPGVMVTARTIDVHVAAIRKKMGAHGSWVRTVRGVGYRLGDTADEGDAAAGAGESAARVPSG